MVCVHVAHVTDCLRRQTQRTLRLRWAFYRKHLHLDFCDRSSFHLTPNLSIFLCQPLVLALQFWSHSPGKQNSRCTITCMYARVRVGGDVVGISPYPRAPVVASCRYSDKPESLANEICWKGWMIVWWLGLCRVPWPGCAPVLWMSWRSASSCSLSL